jgi:hypothetical protein
MRRGEKSAMSDQCLLRHLFKGACATGHYPHPWFCGSMMISQ